MLPEVEPADPPITVPYSVLTALAEAVREPLIVCAEKRPGSHAPGRVLTANPMACALLNRDLSGVTSQPLVALVATSSGRPPPPGLVSKCSAFCAAAPAVSVECDCRVFNGIGTTPLLFYHLALIDWKDSEGDMWKDGEAALAAKDAGPLIAGGLPTAPARSPARTGPSAADDVGDEESSALSPRVKALAEVHIERLKILLVEDDPFSVVAIQELCRQCDFELSTVGSGEECLVALEEDAEQPAHDRLNLVLCDVMMHGMDGREVLREVRRKYGDEIAVIMISSNEQQKMVEACIRAGADSYLFKPLRIADFSNIWQFVMQQRCHKLQAERREMRYVRSQQLARMKQIQAEKLRAVALADAEREKVNRERAEAEAASQRVAQKVELDRQREEMQKEIMRLLHQQVWAHARARVLAA